MKQRTLQFLIARTFLAAVMSGCGVDYKVQTQEAERIIASDPKYRKVDEVCRTISIPEGSEFIGKARMFNSVGISNFYFSVHDPDSLEHFFREHLEEKNWNRGEADSLSRVIVYRKGGFEVEIQLGGIGRGVSYSIFCGIVK